MKSITILALALAGNAFSGDVAYKCIGADGIAFYRSGPCPQVSGSVAPAIGSAGGYAVAPGMAPRSGFTKTNTFESGVTAIEHGDYTQALKSFRAVAARGDARAQYNLGTMYRDGQGVPQDYAQAAHWYRKAAEQGYSYAQYNLGIMHLRGLGVTPDSLEAIRWFRLSAPQGVAKAQLMLGLAYQLGQGVTQNYSEALKWLRLSAAQGDADAQSNLGSMYYAGLGVTQDIIRAYMWFYISAAQGNSFSRKYRDITAQKMTATTIASAQRMARTCTQNNYKDCD